MSRQRKATERKASSAPTDVVTGEALTVSDLLRPMQKLSDTPSSKKTLLFLRKLSLCAVNLDWKSPDTMESTRAKDKKAGLLLEIVDFIGSNRDIYNATTVPAILTMVAANLFRALPPPVDEDDLDEEDPVFDPRWPHLQIVYEVLLRLAMAAEVDANLLKRSITAVHSNSAADSQCPFVVNLLDLFDSEDQRERDYLKTILHRIYAKCMPLRPFIRRSIHNVFFIYMYDTGHHNGIAELLEILGSIINGLALPIKQEHKHFLQNLLIPLHKMGEISAFHPQLAYCVSQFVDKDPLLSVNVVGGLLRFWPVTDSQKELLFLNELEELLELTQPEQFQQLVPKLFSRISECVGSPHFQVAERALYLWQNEHILELINRCCEPVLNLMFPVLQTNTQHHWNQTVHSLSVDCMQQFTDMSPRVTEQLQKGWARYHSEREGSRTQRQAQWDGLIASHSSA